MASILKIPSPLRRFTNGESSIEVNGNSINKVLEELFNAHPDIKGHLVEEDGNLRNFVNIFINGEDVRQKGGLDAEVSDGSDVRIIPSIAGGSGKLSSEEFIISFSLLSFKASASSFGVENCSKASFSPLFHSL